MVQIVKNLLAMQETCVQSLGWEDALEKEIATYSSILAMDRGAWQAIVHGVTKSWTRPSNYIVTIHAYINLLISRI